MPAILVADDHSIVRKGLIFHCQVEFGYTDVSEARDCVDLMAALRRKRFTHLILDLALSDGLTLEILPNIRSLYPELNIMIFSMAKFELYEAALERYGIRQFISKDAPEKEIVHLLKTFLANQRNMKQMPVQSTKPNIFSTLSPRETEVLHYLLLGETNTKIAERLHLQRSNIGTLKHRIFAKTKAQNIVELKELANSCNSNLGKEK